MRIDRNGLNSSKGEEIMSPTTTTTPTEPTAMAAAMRAAGCRTIAERLEAMMATAIRIGKGLGEPSLVAFEQMLRADDDAAELMWELHAEVRRSAMTNLFGRVHHRIRMEQESTKLRSKAGREDAETLSRIARPAEAPKPQQQAGHISPVTQPGAAGSAEAPASRPRDADQTAIDTQPSRVREPVGDRLAGVRRAAQSWLDKFQINGQPIGKITVGAARKWSAAQGVGMRFVMLLTEGLPDNVLCSVKTAEEAEQCWRLASEAANA